MRIQSRIVSISEATTDTLIYFAFEKEDPSPALRSRLEAMGRNPESPRFLDDFKAKPQELWSFRDITEKEPQRVLCVGLGPRDKFGPDKLRVAAATALRRCREIESPRPALVLENLRELPMDFPAALDEALLAALTGLYRFDGARTKDIEPAVCPEMLVLASSSEPDPETQAMADRAAIQAEALAAGIALARDLTNAPANTATPSHMEAAARRLATTYGFGLKVLGMDEAVEEGLGAFAAVAQGSAEPPRFIVLEHAPEGLETAPPVVLVGKGITFDSGGINIKHSEGIATMKHDMAGAAVVLGAMQVLGALGVPRRVAAIVPCTENMPGSRALKPGDVVRSLSGLTVEVVNTDAEGRLILCDALAYGLRYEPAFMIDIATLTGACLAILGHNGAVVMGNDEKWVETIRNIGMETGEKLWPLPLWEEYFEGFKSDVADLRNQGDRTAGTIAAGMFLKQFVPDGTPWVHLDIAGTAWAEKDSGIAPRGATGFGVRILVEAVRRPEPGKAGSGD